MEDDLSIPVLLREMSMKAEQGVISQKQKQQIKSFLLQSQQHLTSSSSVSNDVLCQTIDTPLEPLIRQVSDCAKQGVISHEQKLTIQSMLVGERATVSPSQSVDWSANLQEQTDEIAALMAIFNIDDDDIRCVLVPPAYEFKDPRVRITVKPYPAGSQRSTVSAEIVFCLPPPYPSHKPVDFYIHQTTGLTTGDLMSLSSQMSVERQRIVEAVNSQPASVDNVTSTPSSPPTASVTTSPSASPVSAISSSSQTVSEPSRNKVAGKTSPSKSLASTLVKSTESVQAAATNTPNSQIRQKRISNISLVASANAPAIPSKDGTDGTGKNLSNDEKAEGSVEMSELKEQTELEMSLAGRGTTMIFSLAESAKEFLVEYENFLEEEKKAEKARKAAEAKQKAAAAAAAVAAANTTASKPKKIGISSQCSEKQLVEAKLAPPSKDLLEYVKGRLGPKWDIHLIASKFLLHRFRNCARRLAPRYQQFLETEKGSNLDKTPFELAEGVRLAFHGTASTNMFSIATKGLLVGGSKHAPIAHGKAFGTGVYCSPDAQTAAGYGQCLFVCAVLPGHPVLDAGGHLDADSRMNGSIWVIRQAIQVFPIYLLVRSEG